MTLNTPLNPVAPSPILRPSKSKWITGEKLFAMGDIGPTELVEGRIIHQMPTGHPHGHYEVNFVLALGPFVKRHKLGRVLSGEVGVYVKRNPDTIRAVDVAYISKKRLAQAKSEGYLDVAPELIVEVISPNDSWQVINKKLKEYFSIGTQLVWIADPKKECVYVYHSPTEFRRFNREDELSGENILSGFSVPVIELFEDI